MIPIYTRWSNREAFWTVHGHPSPTNWSRWSSWTSWTTPSLDFTQNLTRATDALALVRRHLWLASEGFSLSAAGPDIQELPVALYQPLADSLAHTA